MGCQARGYHFQSKTRRGPTSVWAWQLALERREVMLVRQTYCAPPGSLSPSCTFGVTVQVHTGAADGAFA